MLLRQDSGPAIHERAALTARSVSDKRSGLLTRLARSEHVAGWAFVLPRSILIAVFALIPIGWSLLLSFQANNLISPAHWVGLANYRALAKDPQFRSAIGAHARSTPRVRAGLGVRRARASRSR